MHPKSYPAPLEMMYLGDPIEKGSKPTVFYFSLSANQSLTLDPYNSLPALLDLGKFRIFSMTLPFHEEKEVFVDPMPSWIQKICQGDDFLDSFFQRATSTIQTMQEQKLIDYETCFLSGLSRGAYIALQLLKRLPIKKGVLFAPFFNFEDISKIDHPSFSSLDLFNDLKPFCDKQIQTFIGNNDELVNTDRSFQFTKQMATLAKEKKASGQFELFIRQSIGHKGHGTSKDAFTQGAKWIEKNL